jgi:uroporphyrin-III C-methyltransferase
VASAVTFVSAHGANGDPPDWEALVRSGATLVIFMGVSGLQRIVCGLIAAGLDENTPAAAIERATCADQRVLRSTVLDIAAVAERESLRSPAILVVGRTVAIADEIVGRSECDTLEHAA